MKMITKILVPIIMGLFLVNCGGNIDELNKKGKINKNQEIEITESITSFEEVTIMEDEDLNSIKIIVNNKTLEVALEDNASTKAFVEKLKEGDITINATEYGGFEKVGSLGFTLPREDKNITTSAGDIVLYQGNQISLFYNSNSWSYTKLGSIINIDNDELKNVLGNGDVTLTFTLSN